MEFKLPACPSATNAFRAGNATHSVAGRPIKKDIAILALGAESAGNFSVYQNGLVYFSQDFGDLLEIANFNKYKIELREYLKTKKIKPDIILTDLHPLYKTTSLGQKLAKKYKAKHISVQHHLAHIFSAIGDQMIHTSYFILHPSFFGVALDGTGYGTDGKIWGGECFAISNYKLQISNQYRNPKSKILKQELQITRVGHLENQIMIGGELAIKEPARMLIGILNKVFSTPSSPLGRGCPPRRTGEGKDKLQKKNIIYNFVKKYYSRNEFELLCNQLQQNFNCVETSSCGRILDAVSLLLGFCGNERNYKHEPVDLLEANSTKPYSDLKPVLSPPLEKGDRGGFENYKLLTTPLFEYLLKNLHKDKRRLATTAQLYIAQGLYEIIKRSETLTSYFLLPTSYLSGGLANNKIISHYLESKNFYANKEIPRGDTGISFGQIVYFLLNK